MALATPADSEPAGPAAPAGALAELDKLLNGKPTLAQGQGIDPIGLEGLYGAARNEYAAGRYDRAVVGFEVLCLYDHLNFDYWLALGRCRQMMREYLAAGLALAMALECMAEPDPALQIDVVECMIAAEQPEAAEAALRQISEGNAEVLAGRLKLLRMALGDLRASPRGGDDG